MGRYPLAPSLAAFCWCIRYILCMIELISLYLLLFHLSSIFIKSFMCMNICLICFKMDIYIVYVCNLCASTCTWTVCLDTVQTEIELCVYCVSFAICVLVIYHICCMLCLVGPWLRNKLFSISRNKWVQAIRFYFTLSVLPFTLIFP